MSVARFRRTALSMPEAVESSHMGHPDFRVGGKIFATLLRREGMTWGMVKLRPDQQRRLIQSDPAHFQPIAGGWGRGGATQVRLAGINAATLRSALFTAWLNVAPKRLIKKLDETGSHSMTAEGS
ncbi:MAG: MmcQ/YjbR family DNA-binding protein [Phycisphaerae bacterium]|nr:MmcQ/YjbR family DNA-binding protein [Phycisphaerae bacterium]